MSEFGLAMPAGWYQVAWSAELAPGGVKPVRAFGEELVLYRGESGELRLLEGACGHMGAHLGYGGTVENDCVRCPFHGWLWDPDGVNVHVPYSDDTNRSRQLRRWVVSEMNGLVLAWFAADGSEPWWNPPMSVVEEADHADYFPAYPLCSAERTMAVHPQYLAENVVDVAHNVFVHRWAPWPELGQHGADGYRFFSTVTGEIPTKRGALKASARAELWGLGLTLSRLHLDSELEGSEGSNEVSLVSITPVDSEKSEIRVSVWPRRHEGETEPSGLTAAMIRGAFVEVFERDGLIWEHMQYRDVPALLKVEARPAAALRSWTKQFYASAPTPSAV